MLAEDAEFTEHVHGLCREHTALHQLLDRVAAGSHTLFPVFEKMLRAHIDREENGLFPAAAIAFAGPRVGARDRPDTRTGAGPRMRGRAHRAWLLLPAGLSLLAGIDAGLLLLEVPAPVGSRHLPDVHGPLMVLGFLGTLIALERAVALRCRPRVRGAGPPRARWPRPRRRAAPHRSARCCCSTARSRSSPCSSRCGAAAATTP